MTRQPTDASFISAQHISLQYPGGEAILTDVSVAVGAQAVGLVGTNGSGKSTLLRLLNGELQPTGGSVKRHAAVGYLPQTPPAGFTGSVGGAFGIDSGGWDAWEIQARAEKALVELGCDGSWLERQLAELSGGELTRVRLAIMLAQMPTPQVLLLDEPTNHMDAFNRQRLGDFLHAWPGGLVIASHDRELLGGMDEIWELSAARLRIYGGNYDAYEEQRAVEDAAAHAAAGAAKLAFAAARVQATQARERQEQRQAQARRNAPKMGLPKIILGMRKRRAEESAAKLGDVHGKRLEAAAERSREAAAAVRQTQAIRLSLPATHVPEGKIVLRADDLNLAFAGQRPLWERPLQTTVTGPRRIALAGSNGAGKTTLIKLLVGELAASTGTIMLGVTPWAYLDQRLAGLDLNRTVLDMFRDHTPTMAESDRRLRLGRLLLGPDHVTRPAGSLSGGERMRAALALALLGDQPAKLLILDEPTNHLDIGSVTCLEEALDGYEGALVVVSHDARFCESLNVDRVWTLDRDGLDVMSV